MTHQLNCQPVTTPSQFVIAVVPRRVTEALRHSLQVIRLSVDSVRSVKELASSAGSAV